jgi:hypothetical protein
MQNNVSFTATGNGTIFTPTPGLDFTYNVSGTFVGGWQLLVAHDGVDFDVVDSGTGTKTGYHVAPVGVKSPARYKFACTAYTSGTIVCNATVQPDANLSRNRTISTGTAKAGTTAGFVVAAGNNISTVTCPASKTASTLVMPIDGLMLGDKITGFSLAGAMASTGAGTLDCALYSQTPAAAGTMTNTLIQSMTQIVIAANGVINNANSGTILAADTTVQDGVTYYLLLTATTDSATSLIITGAALTVTPVTGPGR